MARDSKRSHGRHFKLEGEMRKIRERKRVEKDMRERKRVEKDKKEERERKRKEW